MEKGNVCKDMEGGKEGNPPAAVPYVKGILNIQSKENPPYPTLV